MQFPFTATTPLWITIIGPLLCIRYWGEKEKNTGNGRTVIIYELQKKKKKEGKREKNQVILMVIANGCNIFHSKILDSEVSVEVTDVFRSAQTRQMASLFDKPVLCIASQPCLD